MLTPTWGPLLEEEPALAELFGSEPGGTAGPGAGRRG